MNLSPKQSIGLALALTLTAIVGGAIFLYWAYFLYPKFITMPGTAMNRGTNGLWLRYLWYANDPSYWKRFDALCEDFSRNEIKYAYFHVREVMPDGTLFMRKEPEGKHLIQALKAKAPNVVPIAWLSMGKAYPGRGDDISKPEVRKNVVNGAVWLTKTCGFAGIQYDIKPCDSGDPNQLALLRETRSALGPGKIISVATPLTDLTIPTSFYSWKPAYFTEVAKLCDQMAVMGYSTYALFPWDFEAVLRNNVVPITNAIYDGNPKCNVIVGLPAYDGPWAHRYREPFSCAVKAMREVDRAKFRNPRTFAGIAVFADYTATWEDWRFYRRFWLGLPNI